MVFDSELEEQKQFIQKIISNCGPRLAGSPEEKKAANLIAKEFETIIGNAKVDEFKVHPMAFIGWMPIIGGLCFLNAVLTLFVPWVSVIMLSFLFFFTTAQAFKYKEWFDFIFPKAISQNVYSVLEPTSQQIDYTILLSGHMDSSMEWDLAVKHPERLRFKLIYALSSSAILLLIGLLRIIESYVGVGFGSGKPLTWLFYIIPFLLPGFLVFIQYVRWDKKRASPGAMDNLAGVAIAMSLVKYLKAHADEMPKNCRIILCAFGSEEAGLRGSRAFVRQHQNDLLQGDVWVLNIDGIGDLEYFTNMTGEAMLGEKYTLDLVNMVCMAQKDMGIFRPFWKLDVGASDSVSFSKIGKHAYTFAAQDPTPRNNYHTRYDTWDNLNPEALRKMTELVLRVISMLKRYNSKPERDWIINYATPRSLLYRILKRLSAI